MGTGKGVLDMWWGAVVINLSIRAAYPMGWTPPHLTGVDVPKW
uniref:Uncharacterized protein n=1 Tax=Citrobacter freundii TaxID=546 RepID=A0A0K2S3S8_CITFR|nr:hypothetical protein [Citrobacter freundii]